MHINALGTNEIRRSVWHTFLSRRKMSHMLLPEKCKGLHLLVNLVIINILEAQRAKSLETQTCYVVRPINTPPGDQSL